MIGHLSSDPYARLLPGGVRPWFWTVLLAMTVARGVSAAFLDLHPDEAYYWLWSTRLAGGYYDHPYGVALMIRLTTLVSSGEFWVRFGGMLTLLAMTAATYDMVRRETGSREAGRAAGLLLNVGIAFSAGAVVMTPDTPQVLCWAAGIYGLHRLSHAGSSWWWSLVGLAFGLGMASKYSMVFFGGVLLLALVNSPRLRATVRHPGAVVGVLAGIAAFTPVMLWNARNGFVSFLFQFGHGLGEGKPWSPMTFVELLGGQIGILTPLVAGALVWSQLRLLRRWRQTRSESLLLWWGASAPWLALILLLSVKAKIEQNWPLFLWFTAVGGYLVVLDPGKAGQRSFFRWASGSSFLVAVLLHIHLLTPIVAIEGRDPTDDFHGWKELGQEFDREYDMLMRPDLVFTPRHQLASELAYYGRRGIQVTDWPGHGRTNQFDYWWIDESRLQGRNLLYVDDTPVLLPLEVTLLGDDAFMPMACFDARRGTKTIRQVGFYYLKGFQSFTPRQEGAR
jgi:hypothetical protein